MQCDCRKIIDGKVYDTETATLVADNEYWDGSNFERQGRNTHLYLSPRGRFFLVYSSCWQGEMVHLELLSLSEAKEKYEYLSKQSLTYAEAFGEEPEEG